MICPSSWLSENAHSMSSISQYDLVYGVIKKWNIKLNNVNVFQEFWNIHERKQHKSVIISGDKHAILADLNMWYCRIFHLIDSLLLFNASMSLIFNPCWDVISWLKQCIYKSLVCNVSVRYSGPRHIWTGKVKEGN